MNRRPEITDTKPWYRQFWPWLLISIPLLTVIAGIITLMIALKHPDQLVVDPGQYNEIQAGLRAQESPPPDPGADENGQ